MGNKIVTNKKDEDLSVKLLNELIPRVIKSSSAIKNPKNYFNNLSKRSLVKTPSEINKIITSEIILDFGKIMSDIIITNSNQKNFNINIYLSSFIVDEDKYYIKENNFENYNENKINENEYSNYSQIRYLNKIITSNKILKRIFDYESTGSNNDTPVKLSEKYSKNTSMFDELDLQEFLKQETERLNKDPIYQAKAKGRNLSTCIETKEENTLDLYIPNNVNILKNKHLQKQNKNQQNLNHSLFNTTRRKSTDKPIKLSQRNSKNFINLKQQNGYQQTNSTYRGFSSSTIRAQTPSSVRSTAFIKNNNYNSSKINFSERLQSPYSSRGNNINTSNSLNSKNKEPLAKIRIDIRDLKEDDNSIFMNTEILNDNTKTLFISSNKEIYN
jgi:hypothetical protein